MYLYSWQSFLSWDKNKEMTRRIGCCPFGCIRAPCNNITILTLTVLSSAPGDKKTFYWTSDKNCLSVWIREGVHISEGFIFEFYICVQTENLPFFVLVFWICIFILYSCSNRKTYIQNMKKKMRETKMVVVASLWILRFNHLLYKLKNIIKN